MNIKNYLVAGEENLYKNVNQKIPLKKNDEKEGQDQVLAFRELKSHFDKKFEAINKNFSVETKHYFG